MFHDALLMVAAFAYLGAGMLLLILGTAPADHPVAGWIARFAPVGRRPVPLLAFAPGGLMLAGAVALVAWMARRSPD